MWPVLFLGDSSFMLVHQICTLISLLDISSTLLWMTFLFLYLIPRYIVSFQRPVFRLIYNRKKFREIFVTRLHSILFHTLPYYYSLIVWLIFGIEKNSENEVYILMKKDLWFNNKIASLSNNGNKLKNFFVELIIVKWRFSRNISGRIVGQRKMLSFLIYL